MKKLRQYLKIRQTIMLTESQKEKLDKAARDKGMSPSAYIRWKLFHR